MPSIDHEILVEVFRSSPEVLVRLTAAAPGVMLPAYEELQISSGDLVELAPTERRADLVVLLVHGVPVHVLIAEVQLSADARKRFTWPQYIASARARYECPVTLVVYAPSPDVARWAGEGIEMGHPQFRLTPVVLGPGAVPRIEDRSEAMADHAQAYLSALAHGNSVGGERIVLAAALALGGLPEDDRAILLDALLATLEERQRQAVEDLMQIQNYEFKSEFAKRCIAEGKAEGVAQGAAESLLAICAARKLVVDEATQARIAACLDAVVLERWVSRAAIATDIAEVFAE